MRLGRLAAVVAGMVVASVPAFFLFFLVWPEIVVPAYFVSRGGLLYDTIYFPHAPLLILILAAAGKAFGFSSLLFRSVAAVSLAACGALVVHGVRPSRRGPLLAGLLVGVPLLVLWMVYMEGPMIWPEPFMAPLLLGAVLALERFETTGGRRALFVAGLLLGAAILIKQTAAWTVVSALLWTLFVSRRRSFRRAGSLLAASAVPYVVFAVGWAIAFRTLSHVRWTLLIPISGGFAGDVATGIRAKDLLDSVSVFLVFPAILMLARSFPGSRVLRSPAPWVAIGVFGMAWPRWSLLHLAGAAGIVGLTAARAFLVAVAASRRRRRSRARPRPLSFLLGGALLAAHFAVAVFAGGALLWKQFFGPALWWDDPATTAVAEKVRARVRGGSFLNFHPAYENLYAITGSTTPDGTYVNANFWYLLNREGTGDRLVAALASRPGTPVLFREPGPPDWPLRKTSLYRFLATRTQVIEEFEPGTTWRIVVP
ncbi:MAG: glycosyltransferase family 39 protein [Acidobacteriota bacterium]|nr:glycosyltransferase family 39 protein [Acidobacteriota bacterium]